MEDDVRIYLSNRGIEDAIKQAKTIQGRLNNSVTNLNVQRYKERDLQSGFRKVQLIDGTVMYAQYQSNSKLDANQVIPGSLIKPGVEGLAVINNKAR